MPLVNQFAKRVKLNIGLSLMIGTDRAPDLPERISSAIPFKLPCCESVTQAVSAPKCHLQHNERAAPMG
jgi:hypothetical protein